MATLRERDVFEYCENLFEKLKKEDGGYYPHKHDRLVFEKTAEHFSISDEMSARFMIPIPNLPPKWKC